jgi:hypothetical protein
VPGWRRGGELAAGLGFRTAAARRPVFWRVERGRVETRRRWYARGNEASTEP